MTTTFSTHWKQSVQPRKQRKYRYEAPLHIRQHWLHVHLSKELRQKYLRRNASVRKGDKVKVLRGQFRGKEGRVERINIKLSKVYVNGVEFIKADGSKKQHGLPAANLILTEIDLNDRFRKEKLESRMNSNSTSAETTAKNTKSKKTKEPQ